MIVKIVFHTSCRTAVLPPHTLGIPHYAKIYIINDVIIKTLIIWLIPPRAQKGSSVCEEFRDGSREGEFSPTDVSPTAHWLSDSFMVVVFAIPGAVSTLESGS